MSAVTPGKHARNILWVVFGVTLLFWLAPFLYYGLYVVFAGLPVSPAQWNGNHGPFRISMEQTELSIMLFLFSLLSLLAIVTFAASIVWAVLRKSLLPFLIGLLLVLIQLVLADIQLWCLFWTID